MPAKRTIIMRPFTPEKFWSLVDKGDGPDDCWLWNGTLFADGYGRVRRFGKTEVAHRVAWELLHGPIPDGLMVLHDCPIVHVKRCVRHLYLGTALDNAIDRERLGQQEHYPGELNPMSKLTWEQVREIRRRWAANPYRGFLAHTAKEFDVSFSLIGHVVHNRIWREEDGVSSR